MKYTGQPDARVIEVVTASAPAGFLAYLRSVGVLYLIAGETNIDCTVMTNKLEQYLGIKTLLVCGGGKSDWALLEAGCVDEVSVVFAPVASGDEGVATIFDKMPVSHDAHDTHRHSDQSNREHQDHPIALSLQSIEQVEGDGVHLVWRT